jgi:hypothetical protein
MTWPGLPRPHLWVEVGGEPMPVSNTLDWAEHFEMDAANRRVGLDHLCSHEYVSTVFLGIDYNFGPEGPPLLYETMVFGGMRGDEQWRYATRAEALAGHERIVAEITPFTWAWFKHLGSGLWWSFRGSIILEKYRAKMVDDEAHHTSRSE